ncbi:MAG TPA: hypothetical protein GXZ36_04155 [Firmicutes bacterium]|jgi:hypothetical protein|nr:hypothetical protein [Bacillota bacterium]
MSFGLCGENDLWQGGLFFGDSCLLWMMIAGDQESRLLCLLLVVISYPLARLV